MKERFDLIASSLGSYFGVGFLDPMEQLDIDLGIKEREVDEASEDRMLLGNCMEDASLNYFEKKLGIVIDERNSEYAYAFNGMLKCKRDGRTFYDGVETGVENKYSNSTSHCFTDDFGYILQCHAYMEAWGLDQWLLLGMWQGKPVMKLIKKDMEIIRDMRDMVDCVFGILTGMLGKEDFRWDLVEKYSHTKELKELDINNIEEDDANFLYEYATLNEQKKEVEGRLKELGNYIKSKYTDSKMEDDTFKYSISTLTRRGDIDETLLSIEHPEIDLEHYRKESSVSKSIRVTRKKKSE